MGVPRKIILLTVFAAFMVGPLAAQGADEPQGIAVTDRPLPPAFDGNKSVLDAKTHQNTSKKAKKKAKKVKKKPSKKAKKKAKGGKKKTAVKAKKTQ